MRTHRIHCDPFPAFEPQLREEEDWLRASETNFISLSMCALPSALWESSETQAFKSEMKRPWRPEAWLG